MPDVREQRRAVVVGCDGSWQSERAVVAATREASRRGAALVLLSVAADRDLGAAPLSQVQALERQAVQSAREVTRRADAIARRTDPAVPTEHLTPLGIDAPELRDLRERIDVLVLGGHGGRGQVAFSLGSVSADLARLMPCPVLVPRVDRHDERASIGHPASVVLGLTGGAQAPQLAARAFAEAHRRGLPLVVVTAAPLAGHLSEGHLRDVWEQAWATVRHVPGATDIPTRVIVAQEDAASALCREVNDDDVLVVGTRGGGTLAGLVVGSVARRVLDELPCDVIVVPPAAGGHLTGLAPESTDVGAPA